MPREGLAGNDIVESGQRHNADLVAPGLREARVIGSENRSAMLERTYPSQCSFSPCVSPRASTRSPPPGHSVQRRLPCSP
jgi:hypothetical protein